MIHRSASRPLDPTLPYWRGCQGIAIDEFWPEQAAGHAGTADVLRFYAGWAPFNNSAACLRSALVTTTHTKNAEAAVIQETIEKAGIGIAGPFYVNKGSHDEYREIFATMSQSGANALFIDDAAEHITKKQLIGELAAKYRLPAVYPYRVFVEAGGLMSYGIDLVEIFRQAARDIVQILNGASPADIPFYQPTKFELVVNLKAAKKNRAYIIRAAARSRRRGDRINLCFATVHEPGNGPNAKCSVHLSFCLLGRSEVIERLSKWRS